MKEGSMKYAQRWIIAFAALAAGIAHIPVTGQHLSEAPYMGVAFILFELASLGLALRVLNRNSEKVYRFAIVLNSLALFTYAASRVVAFPQMSDDVGNWLEPLGVVSITAEAVVVLAALAALRPMMLKMALVFASTVAVIGVATTATAAVHGQSNSMNMTASQMSNMQAGAPQPAPMADMPDMVPENTQAPTTLTTNGAPVTGKDPAKQQQKTLGQAAGSNHKQIITDKKGVISTPSAKPHVNATYNTDGEKNAKGKARGKVPAPTVTPGARQDGCAAGYGLVSQCVPLRAPGDVAWTCTSLRTYFPNGVSVHKDQWKLDTNKDGIACDKGDKA